MVKVTATVEIEGAEEIEQVREVLEILGQDIQDIQDITVIRRPIGNIRISGFQKDDRAAELLSIDPEGIIFNDEPVKMSGTEKQAKILSETRENQNHSIEEVADDAGTSTSYAKKVLASATPDDVPDGSEEEEGDDGWGIIGTEDTDSSERQLDRPDEDTVQFQVLDLLGDGPPATMPDIAARSDELGKSQVSSALGHLYDKMMLEAKERGGDNYYYLSEDGEIYLRQKTNKAPHTEHMEYREMFGPMVEEA